VTHFGHDRELIAIPRLDRHQLDEERGVVPGSGAIARHVTSV
jgi:hypothetical protein